MLCNNKNTKGSHKRKIFSFFGQISFCSCKIPVDNIMRGSKNCTKIKSMVNLVALISVE